SAAPARPSTTVVLPTPPLRLSTATVRTGAAYGAPVSPAFPRLFPPLSAAGPWVPERRHLTTPGPLRWEAMLRAYVVHRALEDEVASARTRLGSAPRVLDVGGGSGIWAVPLARSGCLVTVVDPSPNALATLHRRATEAGVAELVSPVQGDADS